MLEGYSMTRTVAPKDLGGRLLRNCARTTPELPSKIEYRQSRRYESRTRFSHIPRQPGVK